MKEKIMDKKYLDQIYTEIKTVEDFPIPGISFKDITPLFQKPKLFKEIVKSLVKVANDLKADIILAPESRGFLFGLPIALKAELPFVLARKPNKLPRESISEDCVLEYGKTSFSIHTDTIKPKQKVLIVDDLLATGGTAKCLENLVNRLGGVVVGSAYCVELKFLNGRKKLNSPVFSIITY